MDQSGGSVGIRDLGLLESSISQPKATFDGVDLYSSLEEKAAILGFSLIMNHPFVDGNKRIGHACMELFLILNGFEIDAPVDEQEKVILDVAGGKYSKEKFLLWLKSKAKEKS